MNAPIRRSWEAYLDHLVRPEIRLLHRSLPSFRVCGYAGLALAVAQALVLGVYLGLSVSVIAVLTVGAVQSFFGLVLATRRITGRELIIYYHHEIAIVAGAAFLLRLLRQPVVPYLDVVVLSIGIFLVCGRLGCLMVGCCHGRPSRSGVCYRPEHAAAGFTHYLVGVRLFPVQALEALYVACVVIEGLRLQWTHSPPGSALAWYVVAYDLGRFCFEFLRGDPDRSYFGGFSYAQWISLLLTVGVVAAERSGILPFQPWHAAAAVGLGVAVPAIAFTRRLRGERHRILHPHHVWAIAHAIAYEPRVVLEQPVVRRWTVLPRPSLKPEEIPVLRTYLGIEISSSRIDSPAGPTHHYALSWNGRMTEQTAATLARLIVQLKRPRGPTEIVRGARDMFHLLLHPGPPHNQL
jgi:hypothetical protein